jgi:predicted acylesterase/phospholipase RssA
MNENAVPNAIPTPICDIVLKGGITSGIVYPLALVKLAEQYRFSCIGGTSAGAIAAAACAAAEYGRRNGYDGFAHLKALPDELGKKLLKLFQPTPGLKPVYDTFIALLNPQPILAATAALVANCRWTALAGIVPGLLIFLWAVAANSGGCAALGVLLVLLGPVIAVVGRLLLVQRTSEQQAVYETFIKRYRATANVAADLAAIATPIKGYWLIALAGSAPGIIIVLLAKSGGWVAFGLLVALLGLVGAVVGRFAYAAFVELVESDYGLCPGIRQPYAKGDDEGFTDWLARLIDEAAGRKKGDDPLTFGDLASVKDDEAPIKLAMMTTSLIEMRPYTLPILSASELKAQSQSPQAPPQMPPAGQKGIHNIFFFEKGEWAKLFPARIVDYLVKNCDLFTQEHGEEGEFYRFPDQTYLPLVVAARMSLSFPGLICAVPLWRRDFSLLKEDDQHTLRRCLFSDGGLSSNFPIHFFDHLLPNHPTFAITLDEFDETRNTEPVWFPSTDNAGSGSLIPVVPFQGLPAFLVRLVDSAKNWQDSLQSALPGYRERIVHVALKDNEGGINLAMDSTTIENLARYGAEAGDKLCKEFDLDLHRWRRFLVAMARMEETLGEAADAYFEPKGGVDDFSHFLARYAQNPEHYEQKNKGVLVAMLARGAELARLGERWKQNPKIRDGLIPQPPTNLRITPKP